MANQRGIVHPNLMSALGGFYPSLCTIRAATETQSATGAVQQGWADAPGLVGLRCRMAPAEGVQAARELRLIEGTHVELLYSIALAGHYPAITEQMQVLVDETAYDIVGVLHDGNHAATRLFVRLVR